MRLESFDKGSLTVCVKGGGCDGWRFLGRLSSLIMVASDCAVQSIIINPPGDMTVPISRAIEQLVRSNPVVVLDVPRTDRDVEDDFGYVVLGRDEGFLCLRDALDENRYSIFIAPLKTKVELASKCAYIIADILGFTSHLSFGVRFGVYELLSNVVEHGKETGSQKWICLGISREGDKLTISIVDKREGFDPTGEKGFDLGRYLSSGKKRGLGLVLTQKITDSMQYSRESGFNRIFFEKSATSSDTAAYTDKEAKMEQFEVGKPKLLRDGLYLITLEGDLDTKGALVMEDLINQLIEQKIYRVALDFGKVPFVSSAGVGILLGMVSTLRGESGDVFFVGVSPKVMSVFRLLNLDDFFTIVDTEKSLVGS